MSELRWTGRGTFSHEGEFIGPGETITVDESTAAELLDHRTGGWERVGGDSDDTDAPFAPDDYTVDELDDELADGDYSDSELDALADAERDGKDRETALEAIADARSEN